VRRSPFPVFFVAAALGFVFAVSPARADLGAFTIRSFDADLVVRSDAGLEVTETILVEFSEPRRGIYRTIPVRYTDPKGYAYALGFRFLGAADENGAEHPVHVSRSGSYVNIRLGDPDVYREGRVTYVIRYTLSDALRHFPEHDEIYWNATGNEWNTGIDHAAATVHLPASLPADSLEVNAWTGAMGARDRGASFGVPRPGTVHYETGQPLEPMQGLTVFAAWPPGYVTFPGRVERAFIFLRTNWILAAPLLALVFMYGMYRSRGRDPEGPAAVQVRYEPPPGVSPGELGTIVDEQVDLRDITATLVDLAVRGVLTIHIVERRQLLGLFSREEPEFERGTLPDTPLLEHEQKLFNALFESRNRVTLKDLRYEFYAEIPGIQNAIYDRLVKQKHLAGKPSTIRRVTVASGVFAGLAVVVVGIFSSMAMGGLMPYIMLGPVAAGVLTALVFAAFSRAMPRRTRSGVQLRAWARGFEEFVNRVETDQLEADRRRKVFEGLLPYALALGVAEKWSHRFEDVYKAGPPPTWYRGHMSTGFLASDLSRSIETSMATAGHSMTAAPRSSGSSGSGGGGFSGGGGGGGGGGSW